MPRVRVSVVADDLGICAERDAGIFECLDHGIVTAAVVLPNGLTSAAACAEAIRRGVASRIGLHLNLSEGQPLSPVKEVRSLLQETGGGVGIAGIGDCGWCFLGMRELQRRQSAGLVPPAELARECRAQLEWFRAHFGRYPAVVNGHQHCHVTVLCCPEAAAELRECGVRYLRSTDEKEEDLEDDGQLGTVNASGTDSAADNAPAAALAGPATALPPATVLCERCAWVSNRSALAMDVYRVAVPALQCNAAFVGLRFCKRVYSADEWVSAVASAAARAAAERWRVDSRRRRRRRRRRGYRCARQENWSPQLQQLGSCSNVACTCVAAKTEKVRPRHLSLRGEKHSSNAAAATAADGDDRCHDDRDGGSGRDDDDDDGSGDESDESDVVVEAMVHPGYVHGQCACVRRSECSSTTMSTASNSNTSSSSGGRTARPPPTD
jgi:predicted glycoside hydrolase/deacetylase ChbG (UPF0249 family)